MLFQANVPGLAARGAGHAMRLDAADPGFELSLLDLNAPASERELAWLSATERTKASRFVFARHRQFYLSAHCQLRAVLAAHTSIPPERLVFDEGPHGKPYLRNPNRCAFNLSHCEGIGAVLIAAQGEIGIDVEVLHSVADASTLAQRHFSAVEQDALAATDSASRDLAFLAGWTRKEACLKAIGSGLSIAPDTFSVGLRHDAHRTRIDTPQGVAEVSVWSLCHEQRLLVAWARVESKQSD